MKSNVETECTIDEENRINQGDLLKDIIFGIGTDPTSETFSGVKYVLEYCVVVSQDCDIENNYRKLKVNPLGDLQTVLILPAYPAEKLRTGTHRGPEIAGLQKFSTLEWDIVKDNLNPRYHYIEGNMEYQLPAVAIDFKHYFTIPWTIFCKARKENYLCTINELFRESLSQRFTFYLSRVALPLTKANLEKKENN